SHYMIYSIHSNPTPVKKMSMLRSDYICQEEGAGVCQFFLLGKCRFGNRCRRSHRSVFLPSGSTKKPRMRTADDVISRILWDPSVEPADFVVGYVDRFLGVLERPFSEFNWDTDPCDCDYSSELALPKHRIQYFTHRGRRVWDRNNRTDRVFGSTGQCLAAPFGEEQDGIITTEGEESLIKQDVENEHLEERNQSKTSIQVPESTRPGTGSTPLNQQEARRESEPLEEEVGKDSVLVVIADQMSLSQSESESRGEEGETEEEWKDYWDGEKGRDLAQCPSVPVEQRTGRGGGRPSKRKPTHFITFQANTPSIFSSFQHLQEELTSLLPSSAPHWLPPSSSRCMLQRFAYLDRNPPVAVSFPLKLKDFGGKVLYLSPQPQPHLQQLNAGLQEDQEGARVFEGVGELKVGKGVNFGRLPINRLHLCSLGMTGDGFYETLCLVNLRLPNFSL
uniref:C3H1-type domain-containing protein n=1 Tax=Oncorhynchus tshawytscha TaxID=74940 RepID=A0AAZ3RWV5_ONCTS